jgi:hypothetical protein
MNTKILVALTLLLAICIGYIIASTTNKHSYSNTSKTVTTMFAKNTMEYNPWSNLSR